MASLQLQLEEAKAEIESEKRLRLMAEGEMWDLRNRLRGRGRL